MSTSCNRQPFDKIWGNHFLQLSSIGEVKYFLCILQPQNIVLQLILKIKTFNFKKISDKIEVKYFRFLMEIVHRRNKNSKIWKELK